MSRRPIALSEDLSRLQAEGYTLMIHGGHLTVRDVPYVDAEGKVRHDGVLIMAMSLAGERTIAPSDHTAYFVGGMPCHRTGQPLTNIVNNSTQTDLGGGLRGDHYLSAKPLPDGRYGNYYDKVVTYVAHVSGPAAALESSATAKVFRVVEASDEDDGPFKYIDTACSRAGIGAVSDKLKLKRVAIIGLGGTGEYILDLVAKTPVEQIHLFDGDLFHQHNAFRGPGAPTLEQLEAAPRKVDHFADLYGSMRTGIEPHGYHLDESNVDELAVMDFVFIAIDHAPSKTPIVAALEHHGIPFIDVGMGVYEADGHLAGVVRVTTSTPEFRHHVHERNRISFVESAIEDEYSNNIQTADLNALNAALAVISWKKHLGFFADLEHEHQATYTIDGNYMLNEDMP